MSEDNIVQKESTVKYLYNVANILPATPGSISLKSYYLTNCRKQTLNGPVRLPEQFSKAMRRCSRCCIEYTDASASYQIVPERRRNRFLRRLLRKNADHNNLTAFQRSYLKNLTHKGNVDAHNKVVITCGACKHKANIMLKKPETRSNVEATCSTTHKSKKKKKRDKFSGLNQDAVLSVTPLKKPFSKKISLQTTPVTRDTIKEKEIAKRNIFSNKKQITAQKMDTPPKKPMSKQKKEKKLKVFQNMLDKTKQGFQRVSLQQFLTDL